MRTRLCLLVLGLCISGQGCNLIVNMGRNAVFETSRNTSAVVEEVRNGGLANAAWKDFEEANGGQSYSTDYARGFKYGFADYLYAGGNGNPPPQPPSHYWCVRYQTPAGYEAIQDWFAGYRQGALAAKQTGLRESVIVPLQIAVPDPAHKSPYFIGALEPAANKKSPDMESIQPGSSQLLPAPRKLNHVPAPPPLPSPVTPGSTPLPEMPRAAPAKPQAMTPPDTKVRVGSNASLVKPVMPVAQVVRKPSMPIITPTPLPASRPKVATMPETKVVSGASVKPELQEKTVTIIISTPAKLEKQPVAMSPVSPSKKPAVLVQPAGSRAERVARQAEREQATIGKPLPPAEVLKIESDPVWPPATKLDESNPGSSRTDGR
jgi:hypothetical protein